MIRKYQISKDGIFQPTREDFNRDFSIMLEHFKKEGIYSEEKMLIQDYDKYKENDGDYEGNVTLECHVVNEKLRVGYACIEESFIKPLTIWVMILMVRKYCRS